MTAQPSFRAPWPLWVCALLAVAAPTLVAFHTPPSMTFFNQIAAVVGWGLWLTWMPALTWAGAPPAPAPAWARRGVTALGVMWLGYGLASLGTWAWWGHLPIGLAWMHAGLCAAALLVCLQAWRLRASDQWDAIVDLFLWALAIAGLASWAIGMLQAFHPQWTDGTFLAEPTMPGRAVGNLRQPNHLATLLVGGAAAVAGLGGRGRLPAVVAASLVKLLIWGVVLSASRTGMVGMVFFVVWGLLDRQLPRMLRLVLVAAPLVYGFWWGVMYVWSHSAHGVTFAAEARLHDGSDISSSRFKIWANVLALVAQHPWWGVGVGEFNVAWTFTPFPNRPVAFFDHTHNVLLQWAVELGIPLTLLFTACASVALWPLLKGWRPWGAPPPSQTEAPTTAPLAATLGACSVIVGIGVLHSMLEYPLWYAHLLLPTAFAWGLGLAAAASLQTQRATAPEHVAKPASSSGLAHAWPLAGSVMTALGLWCALDYMAAANIYAPRAGSGSLEQRIARSKSQPWWGYQADYAEVTVGDDDEPSPPPAAFARTLHNLVDTRLMMAYARSLAEHNEVDKARYVVARLREFHNPAAQTFLSVCDPQDGRPAAERPFQCSLPEQAYTWRDVLPKP